MAEYVLRQANFLLVSVGMSFNMNIPLVRSHLKQNAASPGPIRTQKRFGNEQLG
ncbi:hypothetical protein [Paenibacillus thermotolerans]|uniref:hypothetical protein n=1 Tax=Paenibacillus thermotolerans TaxID=3027807 RepID=UPI002368A4D0|nr:MULTISPECIES: hypothetical protein [unclassified Paenibacillus]